jgi:seryl-tRNA synthetase
MIDIKRIVEDTQEVKNALLKRIPAKDMELDKIVELEQSRKKLQNEYDKARAEQNEFNSKMAKLDKGSEEFKELINQLKENSESVKKIENE